MKQGKTKILIERNKNQMFFIYNRVENLGRQVEAFASIFFMDKIIEMKSLWMGRCDLEHICNKNQMVNPLDPNKELGYIHGAT